MTTTLDAEVRADDAGRTAFHRMVGRLSRLSVDKHFDAYADVEWDGPDMQVDPTDVRWSALAVDPLQNTDWFRGLSDDERAQFGLYRWAAAMKTGWHFENLLQRGLLLWVMGLPNGAPEFRYAHHEIIEESQHTLMFQELVNRSQLPVRGMPRWARVLGEVFAVRAARYAPPTFFFLVLGGEDPADHVQREELRRGRPHPLLEQIIRIHVTEDARHISFARNYLRHRVPRLGSVRRAVLAVEVPLLMAVMTRMILVPPRDLRRHCGLPRRRRPRRDAVAGGPRPAVGHGPQGAPALRGARPHDAARPPTVAVDGRRYPRRRVRRPAEGRAALRPPAGARHVAVTWRSSGSTSAPPAGRTPR